MQKLWICLLIILSVSSVAAQDKIIYFVTDESPPYTINSKRDDSPNGFMIDVIKEIYEAAGYKVDVQFTPYRRSIQEVVDGNVNGVLLVAENSAPGLIFLENPIVKDKVVFIGKKDSKWRYTGVESLEKMRIGSGVGFDFADRDINEYIRKKSEDKSPLIQLVSGEDINLRNFQKLLLGRLDIVIATEKIGRYVAQENKIWNQLEIVGTSRNDIIAQTGFNPKDASNY